MKVGGSEGPKEGDVDLAESDLVYIALQSVRSSFLPHTERMKLMQEFQNSIHELTARD